MKLIFYSPQTLPSIGGLQYVVHYWAQALCQRGHKVVVVTQTKGAYEISRDYEVECQISGIRLRRLVRTANVLLMFNISLKALPWCLGTGTPFFVSHQSGLWYEGQQMPFRQQLKRWVANNLAKGNIACSGFIARNYLRSNVVYNPVRQDLFTSDRMKQKLPIVFFAGRLVTDKGVDILLWSFAKLVEQQPNLTHTLLIAGDGPELKSLQHLAFTLRIEHKIQWLGMLPQQQLAEYMRTAAVMVVPSRMEPMGMIVAEGLACGCNMVVSNQGGMPEVGGAFCRYFESQNVDSLAEALRLQLTAPLPVAADALHTHLEKFTVEYSVRALEKWLGVTPLTPLTGESR